ncbi:hypothetical protein SAMN02745121_00405 [Nannocystis exedens]|uniref:Uncharacterized protein n=1 Tax=Nannocystis exedens TaxID=54 RepID=A0A1I1T0J9_9BACT|nr:DUF4175 family protein [Nannocystis exedens]PCC66867.1 hypothetical protein NAEX_09463 [Nannocystis exedens]SFD52111.1 hypothetical protein SAMN02745121_00405 [Nannocystis exedens]
MNVRPPSLLEFLAAVRRVVRRRELAAAALHCAALLVALAVVAAGLAGWTLRGDLAAAGWLAGAVVTLLALFGRAWRRILALTGTPHRTALTIAQFRGALTRRPREASPFLRSDGSLRREILGATELLLAGPGGHRGSQDLAAAYVRQVEWSLTEARPELAAPPANLRVPALATALLALLGAVLAGYPEFARGLELSLAAEDGRPPAPPEPVWSALSLTLRYPEYSGRVPRQLINPSGAVRALAGTETEVELETRKPASAVHVILSYDQGSLSEPPAPERIDLSQETDGKWRGRFVVRGAGSWHVVVTPEGEDVPARSAPAPLEIEADEPPEIELLPLPRSQSAPSELDSIELRFKARDDFGIASAVLVFEGGDKQPVRLDAGAPPPRARTWQHRYTWDLSSLPVEDRGRLTYWIEVRDNDPGLGLVPLTDPPGKVARSAKLTLQIRDQETEHAENLADLAALRDSAVDLLARRMLTEEPNLSRADDGPAVEDGDPPRRIAGMRELLAASGGLLSAISTAIDALSVDTLAPPRDVAVLVGVHKRLMELHRRESAEHEELPPGAEDERPDAAARTLGKLLATNRLQLTQLEDEVIRLDDLVDNELLAQIEQLVARLQTSQQKLVDLLERLKAGDESVRGEVDQLQQRIREDLRRLSEARAKLDKELGQEFLNTDAFEAMAEQLRQQDVGEQLRQGDVDGALDRARGVLDELRKLRSGVQDRMAAGPGAAMTPEERARMELMREISRIQDEETGLRGESRSLHEQWRKQAGSRPLDQATAQQAAKQAAAMGKALDAINDARLGRDARRALEDAREQLQRVAAEAQAGEPKALPAAEAARAAAQALERAVAGAGEDSQERRQLGPLRERGDALRKLLEAQLPAPSEGLDEAAQARFDALAQKQQGLRARAEQVLDGPNARYLPDPGKHAMRGAISEMDSSSGALGERRGGPAVERQSGALGGLQRALDSLRDSSSPPQTAPDPDEVSTETERDRSLRDELMEAMKERAPEGFRGSVERYYEELLR